MERAMFGSKRPFLQMDLFASIWSKEKPVESTPPAHKAEVEITGFVEGHGIKSALAILEQPLIEATKDAAFTVEGDLEETPGIAAEEGVAGSEPNGTENWTDHDHAILHEALLNWHLAQLAGHQNVKGKLEALQWIYQPDVYEVKVSRLNNGKLHVRRIYASQIPFTFQSCCIRSGYNGEALQNGIEHAMRKAGIADLIERIEEIEEV